MWLSVCAHIFLLESPCYPSSKEQYMTPRSGFLLGEMIYSKIRREKNFKMSLEYFVVSEIREGLKE